MKDIGDIVGFYYQPWRYHHTTKHIDAIQSRLLKLNFNQLDEDAFYYASIFHDVVCEPGNTDNEERSNQLWLQWCAERKVSTTLKNKVSKLILLTADPRDCNIHTQLEREFVNADWNDMGTTHVITDEYAQWLNQYEEDIFREYQKFPIEQYVEGRKRFLINAHLNSITTNAVHDYLMPLVGRKRKIGIYAGSFLPFHIGHLNILRKAEKIFDKVIVAQGLNPEKKNLSRVGINNVKNVLLHHQVDTYDCQLVDYIQSKRSDYCEPVLIRGLRNGYDLNQETNLIRFVNEQANARGIAPIPIAYITCDREFEHISSSAIRMLNAEDASRYFPKEQ